VRRAPACVEHRAQGAVDAEPRVPEASVLVVHLFCCPPAFDRRCHLTISTAASPMRAATKAVTILPPSIGAVVVPVEFAALLRASMAAAAIPRPSSIETISARTRG